MTSPPRASVALDDKYALARGRVFITGTQALVRLLLTQRQRDARAGLATAGYVSGYRGSPLGTLDDQLHKAGAFLREHEVVFNPGVNEDLAATAVWGTQQAEASGAGRYQGVFAMWYGKGPGVDRSGDALRHGNLAGSSRHGGVLLLMGDDHTCESSTTCHQSEFAMVDAMIPVLSPAGVQELLDFGVLGWALSRFSGCWVGMKCMKDTVESGGAIEVDVDRVRVVIPDDAGLPADGLNLRQPDTPHAQEQRLHRHKLPAVRAFARVNAFDRLVLDGPAARLGVITHGKSYLDVLQALEALHLSESDAACLGLRLYKVGMTWPLEPTGAAAFARGLDQILGVEEKRSLLEAQLKEQLYGMAGAPAIIGKHDEHGASLFQPELALDANQIAIALGERLLDLRAAATVPPVSPASADLRARLASRLAVLRALRAPKGLADIMVRSFYFCAGCPHNSSTVLPEGSSGYTGIGCSWMVQAMNRSTLGYTQMGGEGMAWVGEAPFSKRRHMFQNIGDGTYFHSGLLAIRAAVAAGTNITYKILFNDAVAMTGGQRHDGPLDATIIARQVHAEGVKRVVVVSDEPHKYPLDSAWPPGINIRHRDDLDQVQRELRDIPGTTALIYDQTCAAEKRRRRKRGTYPDPARRLVINDLVCEGCGDCGTTSNCVAVQPLETELGRKRTIDQSACNKDYSCAKGFCPSFVTVVGGELRKPAGVDPAVSCAALPEPVRPALEHGVYSILVTGMGGTGVVTIGAILGMAAHLDWLGCGTLDMAGLAQKNGSVWSHLRFGRRPEDIKAIRIAAGGADLVLGCDLIVTAGTKTLGMTRPGHTRVLVNTEESMPGDFALHPDMQFPGKGLRANIETAVGRERVEWVDASRLAQGLLGDRIAANLFMVGYAWQRGLIPVSAAAIERAIELNGVGQRMNHSAFAWGRRAAVDPAAVEALLRDAARAANAALAPAPIADLNQAIAWRRDYLINYQDRAWADRYLGRVERVRQLEASHFPGHMELTRAVAANLFKLMAIKDEYEVARLHTESGFLESIRARFAGDYRLEFNLAPPLLARRNATTGRPEKMAFGAWIVPLFRLLARLRFLRGSWLDPFGHTRERRLERQLLADYQAWLDQMQDALSANPDNARHAAALALARLPEQIRGYGHVRQRSIEAGRTRVTGLIDALNTQPIRA